MHISLFFDDVISHLLTPARAIFLTQSFFYFRPYLKSFWGFIDFLAFLDPKLGPMNVS